MSLYLFVSQLLVILHLFVPSSFRKHSISLGYLQALKIPIDFCPDKLRSWDSDDQSLLSDSDTLQF